MVGSSSATRVFVVVLVVWGYFGPDCGVWLVIWIGLWGFGGRAHLRLVLLDWIWLWVLFCGVI